MQKSWKEIPQRDLCKHLMGKKNSILETWDKVTDTLIL